MRLFTAIQFSGEVKRKLQQVIQSLRKEAVKGNFTYPENLHLTLVFIGESEKTAQIKRCMEAVKTEPFIMQIKGFGCFKRKEGDICWLGIEKNEWLTRLQAELGSNLLRAGLAVEEREYKPHLTLARKLVLPAQFDPAALIEQVGSIPISVEKISLMQSERIAGRLTYTEIYAKALEGGKF